MLFTAFDQGVRHFSSCWIFFAKAFASSESCFAMLLTEKGFKHQLNSYINAVHAAKLHTSSDKRTCLSRAGRASCGEAAAAFLEFATLPAMAFQGGQTQSHPCSWRPPSNTDRGLSCCSHYPLDAGKHTCWDTWISNTTLVDKPCQARGNSRSLQRAEQK